MLGLCCCAGFSLVVASYSAIHGLLIVVASLVAEHRLHPGAWASVAVVCGISIHSSRALEHGLNSCGTEA